MFDQNVIARLIPSGQRYYAPEPSSPQTLPTWHARAKNTETKNPVVQLLSSYHDIEPKTIVKANSPRRARPLGAIFSAVARCSSSNLVH